MAATAAGPVAVKAPRVDDRRVDDRRVDEATGERERFSSQILARAGSLLPQDPHQIPPHDRHPKTVRTLKRNKRNHQTDSSSDPSDQNIATAEGLKREVRQEHIRLARSRGAGFSSGEGHGA
jgi:hypothetical protein